MKEEKLDLFLHDLTDRRIIPAIAVSIAHGGRVLFSEAYGSIWENNSSIAKDTKFDIASLTKVFSGICFMKLVENKIFDLEGCLCEFFPELNAMMPIENNSKIIGYCNASQITWKNVLTHTTGMGWTRPKTRPSLPHIDQGLDDIFSLPMAYNTGENCIYSNLPFILMGKAIEKATGSQIDKLIDEFICQPLQMKNTGYITKIGTMQTSIVPTEYDSEYRKERVWGYVHDENAYLMGGVSAHAGIFSTAEDICKLMIEYQRCIDTTDGILLSKSTAAKMINEQCCFNKSRRGLMWQLKGKEKYLSSLSRNTFGHTGFTGCFTWCDPQKDFQIVLLSNDIYNGRSNKKMMYYQTDIIKQAVGII